MERNTKAIINTLKIAMRDSPFLIFIVKGLDSSPFTMAESRLHEILLKLN